MASQGQFKWAVFGTGGVARKFVLDLRHTAGHTATVVASRARANASAFARSLGLESSARTYEDAASFDVDAVYIATPAPLHEEHALVAIRAGKAILLEKPFSTSAVSAQRIADAAKSAGCFAMEAMWTRFQPLPILVKARLEDGALGELRGFDGCFMAANVPDARSSIYDPARGGGSLLQRGIYPLSLASYWLGEVVEVGSVVRIGDTNVDEDAVLTLRHACGALSTIRSSLRVRDHECAAIHGTEATLLIHGPIYRPTGATLVQTRPTRAPSGTAPARRLEALRESAIGLKLSRTLGSVRKARARESLTAPFTGNGYHYQAEAVASAVRRGLDEEPRMPLSESCALIAHIEGALSK